MTIDNIYNWIKSHIANAVDIMHLPQLEVINPPVVEGAIHSHPIGDLFVVLNYARFGNSDIVTQSSQKGEVVYSIYLTLTSGISLESGDYNHSLYIDWLTSLFANKRVKCNRSNELIRVSEIIQHGAIDGCLRYEIRVVFPAILYSPVEII